VAKAKIDRDVTSIDITSRLLPCFKELQEVFILFSACP